jgi:hypothetical protein
MAIPREMYCSICGGFVETRMYDSEESLPPIKHGYLEDCVERLATRLSRVELHPALSIPQLEK